MAICHFSFEAVTLFLGSDSVKRRKYTIGCRGPVALVSWPIPVAWAKDYRRWR